MKQGTSRRSLRPHAHAAGSVNVAPPLPCPLLSLPSELRNRIYELVIPADRVVHMLYRAGDRAPFDDLNDEDDDDVDRTRPLALLATCKLIHNEAAAILYGSPTWSLRGVQLEHVAPPMPQRLEYLVDSMTQKMPLIRRLDLDYIVAMPFLSYGDQEWEVACRTGQCDRFADRYGMVSHEWHRHLLRANRALVQVRTLLRGVTVMTMWDDHDQDGIQRVLDILMRLFRPDIRARIHNFFPALQDIKVMTHRQTVRFQRLESGEWAFWYSKEVLRHYIRVRGLRLPW